MISMNDKIEANVAAKRSKTYATVESAGRAIEKFETKIGFKLSWLPIALKNGRVAVAIHCRDPHHFMAVLHTSKGWMVFN